MVLIQLAFSQIIEVTNDSLGLVEMPDNVSSNCDYPDMSNALCKAMKRELDLNGANKPLGVLVCGSGIGISIAANRYPYIRAALCHSPLMARLSRMHNNSNVLALGARFCTPFVALEMLKEFIAADFEFGRHESRVKKLDKDV